MSEEQETEMRGGETDREGGRKGEREGKEKGGKRVRAWEIDRY